MEPVSQDYVPCSWKGKKLATFLMLSPESQAQTLSDLDAQCLVFFFFLNLHPRPVHTLSGVKPAT